MQSRFRSSIANYEYAGGARTAPERAAGARAQPHARRSSSTARRTT